jgi:hypothetical protein
MRNTSGSENTARSERFRTCADTRSRPNGFSATTRPPLAQPERPSCSTTFENIPVGMAR